MTTFFWSLLALSVLASASAVPRFMDDDWAEVEARQRTGFALCAMAAAVGALKIVAGFA